MTYQEMLRLGEEQLQRGGILEWKTDAWILFSYVFAMSRLDFLMNCIEYADETEQDRTRYEQFTDFIQMRLGGMPVQYITNEQNFYGYDFYVDERVLIPRQDTEVLVECVEQTMQQEMLNRRQSDCGRLLDVCTGSGCIAITLAHVLKWKEVWASDISEDALMVARRNNEALDGMVQLVQSDLLDRIAKQPAWDVIVSNPPYIESSVIETLACEVKDYEPRLALDGAEDGLCCYRRLLSDAREYLKKEGLLFLEIGAEQGQAVRQLCYENGYQDVRLVADLAGLDRVVVARWCG